MSSQLNSSSAAQRSSQGFSSTNSSSRSNSSARPNSPSLARTSTTDLSKCGFKTVEETLIKEGNDYFLGLIHSLSEALVQGEKGNYQMLNNLTLDIEKIKQYTNAGADINIQVKKDDNTWTCILLLLAKCALCVHAQKELTNKLLTLYSQFVALGGKSYVQIEKKGHLIPLLGICMRDISTQNNPPLANYKPIIQCIFTETFKTMNEQIVDNIKYDFFIEAISYKLNDMLHIFIPENPKSLDIGAKNFMSMTPLEAAIDAGLTEIALKFIDNNMQLISNMKEEEGNHHVAYCTSHHRNSLMLAVATKNKEVVSKLIEKAEASLSENEFIKFINFQDEDGNTALMLAAENDCKDTCQLLLGNKADIFLKNNSGMSAIDIAAGKEVYPMLITIHMETLEFFNRRLREENIRLQNRIIDLKIEVDQQKRLQEQSCTIS